MAFGLESLLSYGKNLMGGGAPAVATPVPVDYSTVAPVDWLTQVQQQPGFNPLITDPSFMQGLTGYTNTDGTKVNGWGGLALGAGQGLANAWMGMQQYGLAKDTLAENKRQFNANYGAQRDTLNTQMEDRQRARVASNAGAYESVGAYMDKNRIK